MILRALLLSGCLEHFHDHLLQRVHQRILDLLCHLLVLTLKVVLGGDRISLMKVVSHHERVEHLGGLVAPRDLVSPHAWVLLLARTFLLVVLV